MSFQSSAGDRVENPSGYIREQAKVPKPAFDFVSQLLEGFGEDTNHFFWHVLLCGRQQRYEGGWVPVAWVLYRQELPGAEPKKLSEAGFLEMTGYELPQNGGKSREWRVPRDIQEQYNEKVRAHIRGTKVDPFTGKRTTRKQKSECNDENNNPYPRLIRRAIKTIRFGFFSKPSVDEHLNALRSKSQQLQRRVRRLPPTDNPFCQGLEEAQKAAEEAQARYTNDLCCYEALWNQEPDHQGEGIYRFSMAYRPQHSGRISHIGGGVQSCSRRMKKALYKNIEGVHNYDIKSSQACILSDYLREAGFDSSWLDQYLSTTRAKYKYAREARLSVGTWKGCLYAVFMGAKVPSDIGRSSGDIKKMIQAEAVGGFSTTYEKFQRVIRSLHDQVNKWHKYLDTTWIDENAYSTPHGLYVRNDTGRRLNVSDLKERPFYERRAKLAAFLLQGREAAFIHNLTLLSEARDFQVISNEHDGLVTIGKVPEKTIDTVRDKLSMEYIKLVEKPFV